LRATTEQLLIVAGGAVQPFDGDLDDYRESLLDRKPAPLPEVPKKAPPRPASKPSNKNLEARIKRLEETMAKLNAKKASIESQLAQPQIYEDQEALKALLLDQAYVGKELEELEREWLEKQAELEQRSA
jgi:ATP-binding cassette subfamily F protein 3